MREGDVVKYSDLIMQREYIKQLEEILKVANIVNNSEIQKAMRIANSDSVKRAYQVAESMKEMSKQLSTISHLNLLLEEKNISEQYLKMSQIYQIAADEMQSITKLYTHENISASFKQFEGILSEYDLLYYYSDDMSDEDVIENEVLNKEIVTEIFRYEKQPVEEKIKKDSAIITLSPINDKVLQYLSENPQALYELSDRQFEEVMAEIYSRLGYKVELTKATRDGGKDIIIRKPEILGDFIYYVECKKYSKNNPVGVGIVRDLTGIISMDKVNGGIIATTSYFSKDARKLIKDKNLDYQIQLHNFDKIKAMLKIVS